ncbi:hypothetical protein [Anaeromyxobacter terrae]|uniref:hypothetical protein n=1 Tax=Anaeromyxobacter terrae TaxID=2925406 RepID=UPI001F564E3C|nr:hypothetical protein [Anaeromyxobacter sp. SG22]
MFEGIALALLLCAPPAELDAHRAELDLLAVRIQELKLRQIHGENVRRELERLLVRAQELAGAIEAELQREGALPAALPPSPDELRERADAARDEADRLAAAVHALDIRITTASNELRMAQFGASLTTGQDPERHRRLRVLIEQRQLLAHRERLALAEAARLETEAKAIEGER